ncbi:MAG TPA: hypothetical protein PK079_24950 [Leptospiraceae bacterium]|nr:hypothetical protein [Leptospiraceae bacterium]HMW08480.1 hypothetical protein [Leptospiraceae bacterium]HMX33937.1 hypothetical protein [Leptospiraceae bacterium]HMY34240.1 hypothetical protein [Leptospiraceae bacterium]HMZ67367.1 hypothetical protein [Leptospiraceae bacterium]
MSINPNWKKCFFLFLFLNCADYEKRNGQFIQEDKYVKNAIQIQLDGINKDSIYSPEIHLGLYTDTYNFGEIPHYLFQKRGKENTFLMDLPEGEFQGSLTIKDNRYYPPFYSEWSSIKIYFGNGPSDTRDRIHSDGEECKNIDQYGQIFICPKLKIKKNTQVQFHFRIDSTSSVGYNETGLVYLMVFAVSFRTFSLLDLEFF